MKKADFLSHIAALYRAANQADHDDKPADSAWMPAAMAGRAGAGALDELLEEMRLCKAITAEEHQAFYDNL